MYVLDVMDLAMFMRTVKWNNHLINAMYAKNIMKGGAIFYWQRSETEPKENSFTITFITIKILDALDVSTMVTFNAHFDYLFLFVLYFLFSHSVKLIKIQWLKIENWMTWLLLKDLIVKKSCFFEIGSVIL